MTVLENNLNRKLKYTGFSGLNLVIDAACGSGDWSYILSELNSSVVGFDNSIPFIKDAGIRYQGISNLNFVTASLIDPPIKDLKADAVICADSLMFANPIITLKNLNSILKKDGIIYISVNGFGWILNIILNRGIKKMDISKINMAVRIIYDTLIRRIINPFHKVVSTVYTIKDLKKIAAKTGFEVIYAGYEGTYLNSSGKNYDPFFDKTFLCIPQSLEIVLKKK